MENVSVWQVLIAVLLPVASAICIGLWNRCERLDARITKVHDEDRRSRGEIWERINTNKQAAAETYARKDDLKAIEDRITKDLQEIKDLLRQHLRAVV